MKISFSTLACPDWSMPQIIQLAANAGYDGIELRFVEGEDSLWKLAAFSWADHRLRGYELPVSLSRRQGT